MEQQKKPPYKYCIVPFCRNTTRKTPEKMFFMVPRGADLRRKWCKIMKRDMVSPSTSLYCCEDHFNIEEDTENLMQYKIMTLQEKQKVILRLKKGVLPHKFQCQEIIESQPPLEKLLLKMCVYVPPAKENIGALTTQPSENYEEAVEMVNSYKRKRQNVAWDESSKKAMHEVHSPYVQMVNSYKRKRENVAWDKSSMKKAMHEVTEWNRSIKGTAEKYDIPRATLQRHLKMGTCKKELRRYTTVFSEEQEQELKDHILQVDGYLDLSREDIIKLAFDFAEWYQVPHPFKDGSAGSDWFRGFVVRHPELTLSLLEPTTQNRDLQDHQDLRIEPEQIEKHVHATQMSQDETGQSHIQNDEHPTYNEQTNDEIISSLKIKVEEQVINTSLSDVDKIGIQTKYEPTKDEILSSLDIKIEEHEIDSTHLSSKNDTGVTTCKETTKEEILSNVKIKIEENDIEATHVSNMDETGIHTEYIEPTNDEIPISFEMKTEDHNIDAAYLSDKDEIGMHANYKEPTKETIPSSIEINTKEQDIDPLFISTCRILRLSNRNDKDMTKPVPKIDDNNPKITCHGCERQICVKDSGLLATELLVLQLKAPTLKYLCPDCQLGVRQLPALRKLVSQLKEVEALKIDHQSTNLEPVIEKEYRVVLPPLLRVQ